MLYTGTISDVRKLGYNLVHNCGKVYDLTAELIYRCIDWDTQLTTLIFWQRAGYILGANFQAIFEDPKNYYAIDPYNIQRTEY